MTYVARAAQSRQSGRKHGSGALQCTSHEKSSIRMSHMRVSMTAVNVVGCGWRKVSKPPQVH